jgi:hypothetical protein
MLSYFSSKSGTPITAITDSFLPPMKILFNRPLSGNTIHDDNIRDPLEKIKY